MRGLALGALDAGAEDAPDTPVAVGDEVEPGATGDVEMLEDGLEVMTGTA
ncbi:hypothetical protein DES44_2987 [Roseateles depolymerans]|uniref:Uncharacterized protein n=1 Tax=Roseateles depolymerans TaxID=76731 RepID=A0A0U3LG82_9BURK|nr:hypothetical protein RD2015_996 [Roseateles depolymerans]REG14491.1 hypothetical protein DES44_2987 [Roseateles depolymerans]